MMLAQRRYPHEEPRSAVVTHRYRCVPHTSVNTILNAGLSKPHVLGGSAMQTVSQSSHTASHERNTLELSFIALRPRKTTSSIKHKLSLSINKVSFIFFKSHPFLYRVLLTMSSFDFVRKVVAGDAVLTGATSKMDIVLASKPKKKTQQTLFFSNGKLKFHARALCGSRDRSGAT